MASYGFIHCDVIADPLSNYALIQNDSRNLICSLWILVCFVFLNGKAKEATEGHHCPIKVSLMMVSWIFCEITTPSSALSHLQRALDRKRSLECKQR